MRWQPLIFLAIPCAIALTAPACGDGGSGNSDDDASLTVEITTVGDDLDTDGYMLLLPLFAG